MPMRVLEKHRFPVAAAAGLAAFLSVPPASAGLGDFLADVGRTLGAPFGGFVESLTSPTLRSAERSGKEVVDAVDRSLEQRIDQIGGSVQGALKTADALAARRIRQVDQAASRLLDEANLGLSERIDQTDVALAARITQADAVLAARITQIDASANRTIDRAMGSLDATLRRQIADAGKEARLTVRELDAVGKRRLEQADSILDARLGQLHAAVQDAVVRADDAVKERLDQLDALSERRVGNLDVIGSRQVLNAENSLVRFAVVAAVLAFVVFLLRNLARELWEKWEPVLDGLDGQPWWKRVRAVFAFRLWRGALRVLLAHLVIAGVGLAAMLVAWRKLPRDSERRAEALLAQYRQAFERSEQALDFTRATYNASQLAILDPEDQVLYQARADKLELIRDVLSRPGLAQRPDAVREVAHRLESIAHRLQQGLQASCSGADTTEDPDLLTLECFVRWRLAGDKKDEAAAALVCGQALEHAAKLARVSDDTSAACRRPQLLTALAANYVRAALHAPSVEGPEAERLERALATRKADEPLRGLEHVFGYNRLVRELDEQATPAYLAMLEAHVEVLRARARLNERSKPGARTAAPESGEARAELSAAQQKRHAAARQVIEAFRRFDDGLRSDPWITAAGVELAAFLLNDAVLTRALFIDARPDADALPGRITEIEDPLLRAQMAPLRIAWARRYANPLGPDAQRLIQYEEANRFSKAEAAVLEFEQAFVEHHLASEPTPEQRFRLGLAAARLGFFVTRNERRVPYARVLLPELDALQADRRAELTSAMNERSLRFL